MRAQRSADLPLQPSWRQRLVREPVSYLLLVLIGRAPHSQVARIFMCIALRIIMSAPGRCQQPAQGGGEVPPIRPATYSGRGR